MENPIKMDDLGVPIIFGNIHMDWNQIKTFILENDPFDKNKYTH